MTTEKNDLLQTIQLENKEIEETMKHDSVKKRNQGWFSLNIINMHGGVLFSLMTFVIEEQKYSCN